MVDRWILSAVLLILLILGVDAAFVVPQGFEVQRKHYLLADNTRTNEFNSYWN